MLIAHLKITFSDMQEGLTMFFLNLTISTSEAMTLYPEALQILVCFYCPFVFLYIILHMLVHNISIVLHSCRLFSIMILSFL